MPWILPEGAPPREVVTHFSWLAHGHYSGEAWMLPKENDEILSRFGWTLEAIVFDGEQRLGIVTNGTEYWGIIRILGYEPRARVPVAIPYQRVAKLTYTYEPKEDTDAH